MFLRMILLSISLLLTSATLVPAATVRLPQTAQSGCWDAKGVAVACVGTGQDGELAMGVALPAQRFSDNSDGTVTDKMTGLIWLKNANCFSSQTWSAAMSSASTLASGACGLADGSVAGQWRLPNIVELESLVNLQQSSAATWLNSLGFSGVQGFNYWSSSADAIYTNYAWDVSMTNGYVYDGIKSNSYFVWPVRGGQPLTAGVVQLPATGQTISYVAGDDGALKKGAAWPSPRFTDNGDQTVTDNLTGLIWTKDGNAPGPAACGTATYKSWQGALDYVTCLNTNSYLGKNRWRLPNRKELTSLINWGQAFQATWLNSQVFSGVQGRYYWSSSTDVSSTGNAWSVGMGFSSVNSYGKVYDSYVWPVHAGQTSSDSIAWYHLGDGKVSAITTNGSSITGGTQFWQEPDPTWSIAGQGDFDGDGIKDFVWWNNSTGQVYIMLMSSSTAVKAGAVIYTEPDTAWKIVATGDIDGNGKTDLIWWNSTTGQVSAMLINGTSVTGGNNIYTEPDTNWKIVAAADFNGNGAAELLWWNSSTGQVSIGQTNGTNASTASLIWTEPNTDWRIAGAGDLDGDGKADIVWLNRTTGQIYGMQTNGSAVTNSAMMYTEPDTNWEIVSVSDYNSDNRADLLWRNQLTGQVYLMPMNGLNVAGGVLLYTEPDTTWRIQGETEWRNNVYGKGVTTTTK